MEDFRLKVFRVVAEYLNFTHAAESLHLTQPAVTLHIKNLEEDLGTRLFDRTGGRVQLTPGGEVLLKYALKIEALYEQARREMGQMADQQRGTLTLSASTTIAQYLLPQLLRIFVDENPRVALTVTSGNTRQVVQRLLSGESELGLIEGPPGRRDVRTEAFLQDEIVLIVPPGHEWAEKTKGLAAATLQTAPLLVRERGSGTRQVVETALKKAGLDLRRLHVAMELDSTEAIKSSVRAGFGVGLVSQWAVRQELQQGTLVRLVLPDLRIERMFAFAYPQGPEPQGLAAVFLRLARIASASLVQR